MSEEEKIKNAYGLLILTLEAIESMEGTSLYKQNFKRHSKALIAEIEKFDRDVLALTEGGLMIEHVEKLRSKLL